MERLEKLRRVKALLEMALEDRTTVPQVLDNWPEETGIDCKLFDTSRWQLVYIQNDEDIIQQEPEYRERMLKILRSLCDEVCERIQLERKNGA